MTGVRRLRHNLVDLAVHDVASGDGRPLLLLHGLGEATVPTTGRGPWAPWLEQLVAWPGPVLGLDFTGHGASTVPQGGGYTAEVLMGDVDAVLAVVGEASVVGRGLDAYIALLIAGARPALVRGAVLADGPGLAGGSTGPASATIAAVRFGERGCAPDPWALVELARDVRPADYAATFARSAVQFSGLDTPIVVAAGFRPPWLEAVAGEPGVVEDTVAGGLARLAR